MKGHKPSRKALELVMRSFYRACRLNIFITLHIDDGCMGGGGQITHQDELATEDKDGDLNDWNDFYGNNNYFNSDRKHIFRYCIFAHEIDTGKSGRCDHIDLFIVADADSVVNHEIKGQAGTFMHELGHTLGLDDDLFDGIDNDQSDDWTWPWDTDHPYNRYANYKSCMNYRYQTEIIDYSDGTHGSGDFDDWGHIDLTNGGWFG